jgi:hypothetical protein
MKRTTVMVDEGTYAELESLARRDGVSTGHLIREAMASYVTDRERQENGGPPNPLPSFVGAVDDPDMQGADVEDFLAAWMPIHEADERDGPWAQGGQDDDAGRP